MSIHNNYRRQALKRGTLLLLSLAIIPVVALPRSAHAGSASKLDFHYQDHPHDGKKCSECSAFVPSSQMPDADGTCRVIAGSISPQGWCMAFSNKG